MTKKQRLEKMLKDGWLSNWKACYLLKSAHADRQIREIRQNPPDGFLIEERIKKFKEKGHTTVFKEFRLIKAENIKKY